MLAKDAQIEALTAACSVLLSAHALKNEDLNPAFELAALLKHNLEKAREGGARFNSPDTFEAHAETYAEILDTAANSDIGSRYWHRSPIWRIDERRQQRIEGFSQAIRDAHTRATE